jgi:hypothetical protein
MTSGNVPPAPGDLVDAWRAAAMLAFENSGRRISPDTLLRIFAEIVSETERRLGPKTPSPAYLQSTTIIGVGFFSDRLLIHAQFLGQFLRWETSRMDALLRSEDFKSNALTSKQFLALQNGGFMRGSKFDWHIHRYPRYEESRELLSLVHRLGGESFYLATNPAQGPPAPPPRLTRSSMDALTFPPTNIPRLRFAKQPMPEVLRLYADSPPDGKCWWFYAEDNDST